MLSNDNLLSFSGGVIYRYGHILIKTSFLNKLIERSYQEQFERIKNNIYNHIVTPLEDDEILENRLFHGQNISKDNFERNILELFNDNHTFSHDQYNLVKLIRENHFLKKHENDEKNETKMFQFIDGIARQAIISIIYTDLGKTFYPNAAPLKGHKPLYDYATLLKSELEALNRQNRENFSPENGYDKETQERYQWQTPIEF